MPLLRIDCPESGRARGWCPEASLHRALAASHGPVVLMVHGYKFLPGDPRHCPHQHILGEQRAHHCPKALSWPQHLGITPATPQLGVAFGWQARGTIWQAHRRALAAGEALARVVTALHRAAPEREVHVLAHSLGVRVALAALRRLPGECVGGLRRIVALAGAEYQSHARQAMESPAGQRAELVNITSRENDFYDFLLERLIPRTQRDDMMLGQGLDNCPNAVTLQLDHIPTLDALACLGYNIAPPMARVCHWSAYLRPGVFGFYRDLFHAPEHLSVSRLRAMTPYAPCPRWSRLRPVLAGRAGWWPTGDASHEVQGIGN